MFLRNLLVLKHNKQSFTAANQKILFLKQRFPKSDYSVISVLYLFFFNIRCTASPRLQKHQTKKQLFTMKTSNVPNQNQEQFVGKLVFLHFSGEFTTYISNAFALKTLR